MSRQDVATALVGYLDSAGYGAPPAAELDREVDELLAIAARWDVGTVVERRLNALAPRHAR